MKRGGGWVGEKKEEKKKKREKRKKSAVFTAFTASVEIERIKNVTLPDQ